MLNLICNCFVIIKEHAPTVNRGLKPKIPTEEQSPAPLKTRQKIASSSFQPIANPPSINRKLKPHPTESYSQTLPRSFNNSGHYNNSNLYNNTNTINHSHTNIVSAQHQSKSSHHPPSAVPPFQPVLDYLELDTSNAPPICQNSAVPSGLTAMSSGVTSSSLAHAFGTLNRISSASSSTAAEDSSIVYKSVDFIKTEAIKRTRQDRAQNISHND